MLIKIVFVLFVYALSILLGEALAKFKIDPFIARKISHISCSLHTALLPIYISFQESIYIFTLLTIAVLVTSRFKIFNNIEKVEHHHLGTLFFPIGMLICTLLYWNYNSIIISGCALVLGYSDSFAAIIGKRLGKYKYNILKSNKTIEGSLAFFVTTVIILIIISFISSNNNYDVNFFKIITILFGAFIISISEAISDKGLDNIFIPLITGVVILTII